MKKVNVEIKNYEWKVSVWKGIKQVLIFGIPFLVTSWLNLHPEISTLTIGALWNIASNWLKNRS